MAYNIDKILKMDQEAAERERQRQEAAAQEEKIVQLPIDMLVDFPPEIHKYRPAAGERLEELKQSIRDNGILNALLVRQHPEGKYQIIAGHNRRTAAREIGYQTVPCIIKNLPDDDDAVSAMNADNLLHRDLLPSERGWAYRQEWEIQRKRNGEQRGRPANNSSQIETNFIASGEIASWAGVSKAKLYRYIRLTYLLPELLELVDQKKIGLGTGEQLSYLKRQSQAVVYGYCYAVENPQKLKEAHARTLREVEADPDRIIDEELLEELLAPKKKIRFRTLKLEMAKLRDYFPTGTPEEVVIQTIQTALAVYFERKEE